MGSESNTTSKQTANALDDIRREFGRLENADDALSQGCRHVAQGLGQILDELDDQGEADGWRAEVLAHGLSTLVDVLDANQSRRDDRADSAGDSTSKFREMFRTEARKRLSGLSISMMGLFSQQPSADALDQSAGHLHAMKGAASMVGLSATGNLLGAMEQVVVDMKGQPPAERSWPTRALLRGFRLLERTVADPSLALPAATAAEVVDNLRAYRDADPEQPAGAGPAQDHAAQGHAAQNQSAPGQSAHHQRVPGDGAVGGSSVASATSPASDDPTADYDGPLEKRILVVDDVETIAASVGFILSELDIPLDTAENGEEALRKLQGRPYSLVISDVDMPRMDGVVLTRMIREDASMHDIPVILLTSLDHPDERDAGIEAGATDYIIKGALGGGELVNRVQELLAIAPDVPAEPVGVDDDPMRILIAEDVETIAASIAFVLSEGPFDIDIARNGAKALARLEQHDYDLVLSDVQMPEMGGLELLEAIRGDQQFAELPVILLTSLRDPDVQERALQAGAERFLVKGEIGSGNLREILEHVAQTTNSRGKPDLADADSNQVDSDLADSDLADSDLADSDLADSDLADSDLADSDLADSDLADSDLADQDSPT